MNFRKGFYFSLVSLLCLASSVIASPLKDYPLLPLTKNRTHVTPRIYIKHKLPENFKIQEDPLPELKSAEEEIKISYTNEKSLYLWRLAPLTIGRDQVLTFNHPLGGKVQVYRKVGHGPWSHVGVTGSEIPYNRRIVKGLELSIPLEHDPESDVAYALIRQGRHRFDARAFKEPLETYKDRRNLLINTYFFYTGAVVSLLIFNLFLFFSLKEKIYLYYCFFVTSIFMTVLSVTGFTDYLAAPLQISLSQHLIVFSTLSLLSSLLFARNYYSLNNFSTVFDKFFSFLISVSFIFLIMVMGPWSNFLGGALLGHFIDILIPLGILTMIFGGIYAYLKGNDMALFYLISWTFMFTGAFTYFAHYYGIFPRNLITGHGVLWGSLFEMIVVSLGLAYKISILDREKKEALIMAQGKREYQRLVRVLLHDIGNPLSLVKHYTKMQSKNPEKFKIQEGKAWNKIHLGLEKISEIITFHRAQEISLKSRGGRLKLENINLDSILEELKVMFEEALEAKGITLSIEGTPHSFVVAEKVTLVNEVLNNLISNAIKFSYQGGQISLSVEENSESITLKIQDTGQGIESERLKEFSSLGQLETKPGTKGESGNGFGLYLAKAYMELYGGYLVLDSIAIDEDRRKHGTHVSLVFKKSDL